VPLSRIWRKWLYHLRNRWIDQNKSIDPIILMAQDLIPEVFVDDGSIVFYQQQLAIQKIAGLPALNRVMEEALSDSEIKMPEPISGLIILKDLFKDEKGFYVNAENEIERLRNNVAPFLQKAATINVGSGKHPYITAVKYIGIIAEVRSIVQQLWEYQYA